MNSETNWAGNFLYSAKQIVAPQSLEELQEAIAGADAVKGLGSRHSFNSIGDTNGTLLSMRGFLQMSEPNSAEQTVTVGGGVTYSQLAIYLENRGWALHNLASLPHISVAGACATATHGSGVTNGNLTSALRAMTVVQADGAVKIYSGEELLKAAVHLGALGVIVDLTLAIEPSFEVFQWVYLDLPFETAAANPAELASAGYSVSLFTNWTERKFNQVWVKSRLDRGDREHGELLGAKRSTVKLHPLPEVDPVNCTEQCGVPGPWFERLPHFRMEFMPSAGKELQSEFFVPVERVFEALEVLWSLAPKIEPNIFVTEVRFIAGDGLLMSPAHARQVAGIHFTWKPNWQAVEPVLVEIERLLEPFGAAPHLGKLFTMSSERLDTVYPGLPSFTALRKSVDPTGKFANSFIDRYLGPSG